MKPTWADILPRVSEPTEFNLAGQDAIDIDDEVATTDWPLPQGKPWDPKPQLAPDRKLPRFLDRIAEVFR